jgi:transcriptional regulator with XRE-family HTH domain
MATTLPAVDSREVLRCDYCLLIQFRASTSSNCRRCHRDLDEEPEPEPITAPPLVVVVPLDGRGHPNRAASVLAKTIRSLRLRNKLSQRQLAAIMSVPRTYVSKCENEKVTPTLASLERLARGLACHPLDLLAPGEHDRQEKIKELLADPFVRELVPLVSGRLGELQLRAILARVAAMCQGRDAARSALCMTARPNQPARELSQGVMGVRE